MTPTDDKNRLFLLKFHAMHEVDHMSWNDCAFVYEAETGNKISPDSLRLKVKRAVKSQKMFRITEFPEKIVVSVYELTVFGCVWCAIRQFFSKIASKTRIFTNFSQKQQ